MVLELPTEIIYYIFDFSVFGLYNENYIDYNEKSYIDNYLLVSKAFNNLFIRKITYVLNNYFYIKIVKGESCDYNFWRNLFYTLMIEKIEIADENFILNKERNKLSNNRERNKMNDKEIKKNERKLFFVRQRDNFFNDFLKRNWLYLSFQKEIVKLVLGKDLFRKNINKETKNKLTIRELKNILKNFNVDFEIDINLQLLVENFEYFYGKYIEPEREYSPRSFKRKRSSEDSETKENKRIKLRNNILQQQECKKKIMI